MDRRSFLKFGSLAAGTYAAFACGESTPPLKPKLNSQAAGSALPANPVTNVTNTPGAIANSAAVSGETIFTRASPGKWAGTEAIHLPKITILNQRLTIANEGHPMLADHAITRHQIRDAAGAIIFDRFYGLDAVPSSTLAIVRPAGDTISSFATCNLHGIWKEDFLTADLQAGFMLPPVFTAEHPGPWAGIEAIHVPTIKSTLALSGGRFRMEVSNATHPMLAEHFISKHEIRNTQGEILAQTFLSPDIDRTPISVMEFPVPSSGIQLLATCNLHGIWLKTLAYSDVVGSYSAAAPGPAGLPAEHIPVITVADTSSVGVPQYTVTVTNSHEMRATHSIYRHQIRSKGGELITERTLDPAVNATAASIFEGRLFQSGLSGFVAYAYCNLHGIWKTELAFEQVNLAYSTAPGPAGGDVAMHKPVVSMEGTKIIIKSAGHPIVPEHYISKHQLRKVDGTLIFEKNFSTTAPEASSAFPNTGLTGTYVAYAFCNLHGIWKTAFTV